MSVEIKIRVASYFKTRGYCAVCQDSNGAKASKAM